MENYFYSLLCPYCGETKSFKGEEGDSFYYTEKSKRKCIVFPPYSKTSGNCTKCKKPLSFLPDYYAYQELDEDETEAKTPTLSSPSKVEQVNSFIADCNKQIEDSLKNIKVGVKELSYDETKEYLRHAITIERHFETMKKMLCDALRYQEAIPSYIDYRREYLAAKCDKRISDCEAQLTKIKNTKPSLIQKSTTLSNLTVPEKPLLSEPQLKLLPEVPPTERLPRVEKPIEPSAPTYTTPGFFNKKKAEAENEALRAQYERNLCSYSQALEAYNRYIANAKAWNNYEALVSKNKATKEKYERDKAAFDEAMTKYEEKMTWYQKKEARIKQELEESISAYDEDLSKAKETVQLAKKEKRTNLHNYETDSHEIKYQKYWDLEVERIKQQLSVICVLRLMFYSPDYLYVKYRNLATVTTLYEYLDSKRCDTLEGPNGAYNLYEAELRSDVIISKLDDVLASLDEIKKNQMILIGEIKEMNSTLKSLDDEMKKATATLNSIDASVKALTEEVKVENKTLASMNKALGSINSGIRDIKANTEVSATMSVVSAVANVATAQNTRRIVANTAATAYYAKANAQMTQALGWLIALK